MDKVSFQEAAKAAGIHLNTVKNWRKAGKLKTAEKVLENGHELWLVDPAEVVQITRQARQNLPDIAEQPFVHLGENKVDNEQSGLEPPPPAPPAEALAGPSPALEQTLVFMRESIVRPLVEDLARARTELGEAKEEIGTLKERVRALEAAQAARAAQPAPIPPAPVEITPATVEPPPAHQEPPRKGFWRRVGEILGG